MPCLRPCRPSCLQAPGETRSQADHQNPIMTGPRRCQHQCCDIAAFSKWCYPHESPNWLTCPSKRGRPGKQHHGRGERTQLPAVVVIQGSAWCNVDCSHELQMQICYHLRSPRTGLLRSPAGESCWQWIAMYGTKTLWFESGTKRSRGW